MRLSGWGRHPQRDCVLRRPREEAELQTLAARGPLIARGNGRAYGDCALSPTSTLDMRGFNRMIAFDEATGILTAEAGVLLRDVIAVFLPRGWFPFVTPGTKFVTIGGMIAADVHGKNHHREGSFGAFVEWIDLLGPDGILRRCGPTENPALFAWTLGGMGLTGIILRAAFRLRRVESGWIRQKTIPTLDLDTTMAVFEYEAASTYSVAWIDCLAKGAKLGRSVVTLGEHAALAELPPKLRADPLRLPDRKSRTIPFDAPAFALNRLTVASFNSLYWRRGMAGRGEALVGWDGYFYPLDALLEWNRIYGARGFLQFQCAIPLAQSRAGLAKLLTAISESGQGSFLAVLKRLGAESGPFSFPLEGYTLALDFPASRRNLDLLESLDRIVVEHGGRFYLAKDGRMSAHILRAADARTEGFAAMRRNLGLSSSFQSSQSERLHL